MSVAAERRALQIAIALGCLVPLLTGAAGMVTGARILGPEIGAATDLDSHFRYLSGLLFGLGIGFLSCVPRIEARGRRIRLLGLMVIIGGLARAGSLAVDGAPSLPHQLALGMELALVPLLLLWQHRIARRLGPR